MNKYIYTFISIITAFIGYTYAEDVIDLGDENDGLEQIHDEVIRLTDDEKATLLSSIQAESLSDTPPTFFTREEWGVGNPPTASRQKRNNGWSSGNFYNTEASVFPLSERPSIWADIDSNGYPLLMPIYKDSKKEFIAVHHTVSTTLSEDASFAKEAAQVKAIWQYHAYTRKWGDIGYNFLIAPSGNIYEGRAGGADAVGAGVYGVNVHGINIALMGNYQSNTPFPKQLFSLALLSAYLSNKYAIDPTQEVVIGTRSIPAFGGHREIALPSRGTACPGIKMMDFMPLLRSEISSLMGLLESDGSMPVTRDLLMKTTAVKKFLWSPKPLKQDIKPPLQFAKLQMNKSLEKNMKGIMSYEIRNNTSNLTFKKGVELTVQNAPSWLRITNFRLGKDLKPGESGPWRASFMVLDSAVNGDYTLDLEPTFLKNQKAYHRRNALLTLPLSVSGNTEALKPETETKLIELPEPEEQPTNDILEARQAIKKRLEISMQDSNKNNDTTTNAVIEEVKEPTIPHIRVLIDTFQQPTARVVADDTAVLMDDKKYKYTTIDAGEEIFLSSEAAGVYVKTDDFEGTLPNVFLQGATENTEFKVLNYNRGLSNSRAYNEFLGGLKFYSENNKLLLIVRQTFEHYLYGVAEEPSSEPDAKKDAIWIASRSYIGVYSQDTGWKRKFEGEYRYDLKASPACCIFYLGDGWTDIHTDQIELVDKTRGLVGYYGDKVAILPYYTQSSGYTNNTWKSQYPYLIDMPLPYDNGLEAKGHGNGMSGNTSRKLAEKGYTYEQILDYFYKDIELKKLYE